MMGFFTFMRVLILVVSLLLSVHHVNCDGSSSIREQMCDLPVKELRKNADKAMMNKQYTEAVEIFSLLIEKEPEVERHYLKRSQAYEKLKKFRTAVKDMHMLLKINPLSTSGLNLRARVHMAMGWCEEAFDDYSAVLRIKPSHGDAKKKLPQAKACLENMNQVLHERQLGNHENAERLIDELINNYGKALHFLFLRAESRMKQQKYYEAIADLGTLLKSAPWETEALYMRAISYYYLTEYEAAKKHIKEIMKYDLNHEEARTLNKKISMYEKSMRKGKKAAQASDFEEAIVYFDLAVKADQEHPIQVLTAYTEICEVFMQAKNYEQASQYCEAALSADHERRLEICIQYAEFHLNQCDSDVEYDLNMRLWHKCREAAGNTDTHQIRQGMQKSQMMHKRFKQKDRDYYGILGIAKDASSGEIKKKYRKLAKELHPDRHTGKPEAELKEMERKFQRVAQAYEILTNDDLRRRYDAGEDVEDQNGQRQQQQRGFHGFPFNFRQGGHNFRFH